MLIAVLLLAVFGAHQGMTIDGMGVMGSCALMGAPAAMCPMGVLEHAAAFRALFAPVPEAFALLLAIVLLVYAAWRQGSSMSDVSRRLVRARQLVRDPSFGLFLPLRVAFARGILHPKIYSAIV